MIFEEKYLFFSPTNTKNKLPFFVKRLKLMVEEYQILTRRGRERLLIEV